MGTNNYWGYHLILDCSECNFESITNKETINMFVKQLVNDIDMIAYGEPQIIRFGEGDLVGYTLMQLIETSNINCHFVDVPKSMYLDVFSCKEYDTKIVIDLVKKYFDPKTIRPTFLIRHAN